EKLTKAGFTYTTEQKNSDDVEEGYVIKTSPKAGSTRKKGDTITIVESIGGSYHYLEDYTGKNYTEVFRIRRTWGKLDFYAMAINGYTDDNYGKYVEKVLPTLNKSDLRILRNTIFAIYGVHFKSADLSKHFNKQVWYSDEGKTSVDITLPENRQKLVEMIQKLEK
ncbi:MAG: YARHG domain-containing protein, partial [Treponema sp.]|nr:YARHG domain-containing protein [Treponema sp.]